jgi:hypothetical protein
MSHIAHDPYRPRPAATPKPSTLPVSRLRRLGMDQRGLNVMDAWWEAMDHPKRIATAAHFGVLKDDQLATYIGAISELEKATEANVLAWVKEAPAHKRASNAALALAVESTRSEKRPVLIGKLRKLA